MPKYCLSEYMGAGTESDPYRPLGVENGMGWAAIDFRPNCTVIDGFCIVAYPDDATIPKRAIQISSFKTERLNLSAKTAFSNAIGLNVDSVNFDELLLELLTTHSTPPNDKTRWNPIQATKDKRFEVWMGEKIVDIPFVGGGATYTESFNVADVNPFTSGDLTWNAVQGAAKIVSNQYQNAATGSLNTHRAQHDCSTDDNYSQAVIASGNTATDSSWRVSCRFQSGANTHYRGFQGDSTSANGTLVQKVVTGIQTTLSTSSYTKVTNEVIKIQASGSTITFYCDGASNISLTDTAITTGTRGGISSFVNTATSRSAMDSFEMGDLVTNATTAPSTISRSFAINAPALNSTHNATAIARSFTIEAPTVLASSTVSPSAIARSFSIGAPTVAGGSGAYPSVLAMSTSFPAPTVTGDSVVVDASGSGGEVSSRRRRGSAIGKPKTR